MKFEQDIKGKRVLVRVDFNVPMEKGVILNDNRIKEAMPTIQELYNLGAKVIICSHFGRPEGKENKEFSLKPIYEYIRCNIDDKIHWAGGIVGKEIIAMTKDIEDGTSLLLENVRFDAREESNDDSFAKELAKNADYFVDDAFGVSHRKHASNSGVTKYLPSQTGLLMQKERENLNLSKAERPFVAIMGGAKVKDKIQVIKSLLRKVDILLIGGALSIAFIQAQGGKGGRSSVDDKSVAYAKDILNYASKLSKKIVLPKDFVVSISLTGEDKTSTVKASDVSDDDFIVDVGSDTLKVFSKELKKAKTVFWNGPLGITEISSFAKGTHKLIKKLSKLDAKTIVGGGDSVEVVYDMGVQADFNYISTGGGAGLDYISGLKDSVLPQKLCMVILDGYGIREQKGVNKRTLDCVSLISNKKSKKVDLFATNFSDDAVRLGTTDEFKNMVESNPHTLLNASSEWVGLPLGQMGNSEVGHLNIGAGEIVYQDYLKINNQIKDETFYQNVVLNDFIDSCLDGEKCLHLIGLVSDGGVHSHINHLFALLNLCKNKNCCNVAVHIITDGRDTDINKGIEFVKSVQEYIDVTFANMQKPIIASVGGRYYAMDRDNNSDRIDKYIKALTSKSETENAIEGIQKSYDNNVTDEFIVPFKTANIELQAKDKVIFFNFRADRMRQLVKTVHLLDCDIVTFTEYDDDFDFVKVAFVNENVKNCLSEIISDFGLKQLKVAETTKYAHVTYYLNGGREQAFEGEARILVDTEKVATFDLSPKMRAKQICDNVCKGMDDGYDFIAVNFANCDMVGHTGNLDATIIASQEVTEQSMRIVQKAKALEYVVVIIADHGNAEIMGENGHINTTHTTSRVPFIVVNAGDLDFYQGGSLCNITPTILKLMKLV